MNILLSCPGIMVETVRILKEGFARAGFGVIATGNSDLHPALYEADKAFIVPSVGESAYIPCMLEICQTEKVKALITLLDSDIMAISQSAGEFRKIGVIPLVADFAVAAMCDNKFTMYQFCTANGFKCAKTFNSLHDFTLSFEKREIDFPVFIKPRIGDGGRGGMTCSTWHELELACYDKPQLIIQEYLDGQEYSVDAYVDMFSGELVSMFAKENLVRTIGGPTKSVSVQDKKISELTGRLSRSLGARGFVNIDLFKIDGEYYVGEVNPRLGANYMWAFACGVDFTDLIINNIHGSKNIANLGNYESGALLLKYDQMLVVRKTSNLTSFSWL